MQDQAPEILAVVARAVAHALSADVKSYPLSPNRVKELVGR